MSLRVELDSVDARTATLYAALAITAAAGHEWAFAPARDPLVLRRVFFTTVGIQSLMSEDVSLSLVLLGVGSLIAAGALLAALLMYWRRPIESAMTSDE